MRRFTRNDLKVKTAIVVDRYGNFEVWVRSKTTFWYGTFSSMPTAIRECSQIKAHFLRAAMN